MCIMPDVSTSDSSLAKSIKLLIIAMSAMPSIMILPQTLLYYNQTRISISSVKFCESSNFIRKALYAPRDYMLEHWVPFLVVSNPRIEFQTHQIWGISPSMIFLTHNPYKFITIANSLFKFV